MTTQPDRDREASAGPSRRTILKGAAWSVPVLAVGSAAPAVAASPCEFEVLPGSFKCCSGPVKNMKLVLRAPSVGCIGSTAEVCVSKISLATGGQGKFWPVGQCVAPGGEFTVYLDDAPNCTVNLIATYTVGTGPEQTSEIKSANIPNGSSDDDCLPMLLTVDSACRIFGTDWNSSSLGYNQGFVFWSTLTNRAGRALSVKVTSLTITGSGGTANQSLVATTLSTACSTDTCCIDVPAGGTVPVAIFANGANQVLNGTVNVFYEWYEGTGCSGQPIQDFSVSNDLVILPAGTWTPSATTSTCTIPTAFSGCTSPPVVPSGGRVC